MGESSSREEETVFMDVTSEYLHQRIRTSYDCDPGAGGNASSSQRRPFIDTDPLSELVWSPMKGLCLRCADGTDAREKSYLKWQSGSSTSPLNTKPFVNLYAAALTGPQETKQENIKERTMEKALNLQSSKKRKVKSVPGSSKSYIPSPLGKNTLTMKTDVIPEESSKGNSIGNLKGAFPNDNSSESVESCSRADPQKQTDISMIYETKKLNYIRDSSSFRRNTSFMMWVSNMFKDQECKDPKALLGCSPSSSFRPHNDDEKSAGTLMLLTPENDAKRVKLSNDTTTTSSLDGSSSWITRFNPSKLVITSLPRYCTPLGVIFEGVMKLQISRADITKWLQLQRPLSNLEGFFLRLRLAKWSVTRYLVAIISGVDGTIGEETKVSIGVEVNGVRCSVECQYISNQLIREDELHDWWSSTSQREAEMPSEEDLRLKFERKKLLGF